MSSTPEGSPSHHDRTPPVASSRQGRTDTVTCEGCGFRYGAEHLLEDGKSYSCPLCENEEMRARIREMEALLKVAQCPSCNGGGAIPYGPTPDGDWEWYQCQWCDERDALNQETTDDT